GQLAAWTGPALCRHLRFAYRPEPRRQAPRYRLSAAGRIFAAGTAGIRTVHSWAACPLAVTLDKVPQIDHCLYPPANKLKSCDHDYCLVSSSPCSRLPFLRSLQSETGSRWKTYLPVGKSLW